ncbi:hypothetical protein, partial [Sulfobacillus harzensis]|uniref:hypothetical protein n=1 Tax=Sulfobacillus harzensis TaxID=2729629 RepID=UPI001FAB6052
MLILNLKGLSFENRVKVSAEPPGISRPLIAVLAFCPHPINRGTKLLNERLDRLRVQREAAFEMGFELRFGRPRPMAPPTKTVNLDQMGPQVSSRASGGGRLGPFGRGEGNPIGED